MAEAAATLYPNSQPSTAEPAAKPAAAAEAAKPVVDAPKGSEPAQAAAAPQDVAPVDPTAFTLPDDFKVGDTAKAKFTEALKSGLKDGKLTLTGQQIVDLYVSQARDAQSAWQDQIKSLDAANLAACKKGFTAEEISAAETAVGWMTSRFDPSFRDDYAKRQLNDPRFVRLMSMIHDAYIAEDTFEPGTKPSPATDTRNTRQKFQEKFYGPKPN
jgi:hypothetical protein